MKYAAKLACVFLVPSMAYYLSGGTVNPSFYNNYQRQRTLYMSPRINCPTSRVLTARYVHVFDTTTAD